MPRHLHALADRVRRATGGRNRYNARRNRLRFMGAAELKRWNRATGRHAARKNKKTRFL